MSISNDIKYKVMRELLKTPATISNNWSTTENRYIYMNEWGLHVPPLHITHVLIARVSLRTKNPRRPCILPASYTSY